MRQKNYKERVCRRLLSFVLSLVMIFTLLPMERMTAYADVTGSGTENDPYIIHNSSEFKSVLNTTFTGVYYKLADNFDNKEVIKDVIQEFKGILDGNGQTLNVNINFPSASNIGLFKKNTGTISNLNVTGVVTGTSYVGGICGYNEGGSISQCSNNAKVTGNTAVGGIAGYNEEGSILKCNNAGSVNGYNMVGGICGYNNLDGELIECQNNGNITADKIYVDGITGKNGTGEIDAEVKSCENLGNVVCKLFENGNYIGYNDSQMAYLESGDSYKVIGKAGNVWHQIHYENDALGIKKSNDLSVKLSPEIVSDGKLLKFTLSITNTTKKQIQDAKVAVYGDTELSGCDRSTNKTNSAKTVMTMNYNDITFLTFSKDTDFRIVNTDKTNYEKWSAKQVNEKCDSAYSAQWTLGNLSGGESVTRTFYMGCMEGNDEKDLEAIINSVHTHKWVYSAEKNKVEAYCSADACPSGTSETNKLSLTLSAPDSIYSGESYNGADIENNITSVTGAEAGDITYVGRGDTSYDESTTAPVNAGTYTAKVTIGEATATVDFTIEKSDLTLSLESWVNGDEASAPVINIKDKNVTVSYFYKKQGEADTEYKSIIADDFGKISAGKYTLKAEIAGNQNYNTSTVTCNFEVRKKSVEAAVSLDDWTYGDTAAVPKVTVKAGTEDITNLYDSSKITYTYYVDSECENKTTSSNGASSAGEVPKNAGTYYVKASIEETNDYEAVSAIGEFTISKKSVTAKVSAENKTYDGTTEATVKAVVSDSDLVSGDSIIISGVTGTFDDANAGTDKIVNVDSSKAVCTGNGIENYDVRFEEEETKASIIKAKGSISDISDISKVYDGTTVNEPTFTSTNEKGEENANVTIEYKKKGESDSTYTKTAPKNYGKYVVRITVAADSNYEAAAATKEFSIHKKEIKVTADGYTGIYDGEGHGITVRVTDPADTSDVEITYGVKDKDGKINYSDNEITYKDAGEYTIYYKVTAENHEDAEGSAVVKIIPKTVSLEWTDKEFTYDGKTHIPSAKVNDKDIIGSDKVNVTVSGEQKNAGSAYTAKAETLDNSNYALPENTDSRTTEFIIRPATATVTIDDAAKHIGKEDPKIVYKAAGLADGDSLKGITITREEGEEAGEYDIIATEKPGSNPNYNIEFVAGKFTIEDHTAIKDASKTPTCTEPGLTEGSHCAVCGKVLVEQKEVEALGHDWSDWVKSGDREKSTCSRCGQVKYRNIESTDDGKLEKDAEVAKDSPIAEATLDNNKSQLIEAGGIFTEEEKTAIENGAAARVWLEISASSDIPEKDKKNMETEAKEIMGKDISKMLYFDADLFKSVTKDGTTTKSQITEPGTDIEVSVSVPDTLIQKDSTIARAYKIIRLHNGKVDSFDAAYDKESGTLTFKTDRFSTYAIAFTDAQLVTDVTITAENKTLTKKGETIKLTADVAPDNAADKNIKWTSSDTSVATVDENGVVTAVGNGTAVITATAEGGGKTATMTITVNVPSDDDSSGDKDNAGNNGSTVDNSNNAADNGNNATDNSNNNAADKENNTTDNSKNDVVDNSNGNASDNGNNAVDNSNNNTADNRNNAENIDSSNLGSQAKSAPGNNKNNALDADKGSRNIKSAKLGDNYNTTLWILLIMGSLAAITEVLAKRKKNNCE